MDKVYQAAAFLTLAFRLSLGTRWFLYLWLSVLLAIGIEVGQGWLLPNRTASVGDLLADGVGIVLALIVNWLVNLEWFVKRR